MHRSGLIPFLKEWTYWLGWTIRVLNCAFAQGATVSSNLVVYRHHLAEQLAWLDITAEVMAVC